MTDEEWKLIRENKLSPERPPEWPLGVRAISMKGLGLLGIHESTGKLYWDGQEVATSVGLKRYERILATIGASCAVVSTLISILKAFGKVAGG